MSQSLRAFLLHPLFFFFNDTATTEIYTLSLHDALPISAFPNDMGATKRVARSQGWPADAHEGGDRKSTRLNSSHRCISYAVFCLKKKIRRKTNALRLVKASEEEIKIYSTSAL